MLADILLFPLKVLLIALDLCVSAIHSSDVQFLCRGVLSH